MYSNFLYIYRYVYHGSKRIQDLTEIVQPLITCKMLEKKLTSTALHDILNTVIIDVSLAVHTK